MGKDSQHDDSRTGHVSLFNRRLSWEELRLLCRELEAIAESGFPMVPALASLGRDMKRSRLKSVVERLRADLEQGHSLDYALERQGERFPPTMTALIHAGEVAGNLTGVLGLMSTYAQHMCRVAQSIRTAMIYPLILIVTSLAVFGYLLVWVVPSFQETFSALDIELLSVTTILFQVSDLIHEHGLALGMGAASAAVLFLLVWSTVVKPESRRNAVGLLLLMLPIYGRIYHAILQARFSRTLRLLFQSNVPAVDAIVLSGAATGSAVAERASVQASTRVAEGERLADALRGTGFFGHKFCWLLGAGEDRGNVEDALEHIADNLEREIEASEQAFGMLLAPLITVAVAGFVGFFLIALYVPFYGAGKGLGVE